MIDDIQKLASHRHSVEKIRSAWPAFLNKRATRLAQQARHGQASEKVTEYILEDLFTEVLDWSLGDLNYRLNYAGLVLTNLGIKHLVVEVKCPGALVRNQRAVAAALEPASRYTSEQKIKRNICG